MEIIYRSNDGLEFDNAEDCAIYEQIEGGVFFAAKVLKSLCNKYVNFNGVCEGCPFADGERCFIIGAPWIWDIKELKKNE